LGKELVYMRSCGFYELLRHGTQFVHALARASGDPFELVLACHHYLQFPEREV